MNLPKVIAYLVQAQDHFDSNAYADCFSKTASVFDEGKTYNGHKEIEQWISHNNEKYKTVMKPIAYKESGTTGILSAEISGTFPGSPIVLQYHFEFAGGLIELLKITG